MAKHVKHWRCTAGHGITQYYSDPEYFEISCAHGGVVRGYVNHIEEGDRCGRGPAVIIQGEPYEICKALMVLERDDVTE